MHSVPPRQFEAAIHSALGEPSAHRAFQALKRVIGEGKTLLQRCQPDDATDVRAAISCAYRHLAALANSPTRRLRCRANSLSSCSEGLRENPTNAKLVLAWSESVTTWAYDSLCPPDRAQIQNKLAHAWRNCRSALDVQTDRDLSAALLSQWSSVHRCQAALFGPPTGRSYVSHALRVSESNVSQNPGSALANLDLGLSLWSAARFAQSEDDFYDFSQRAEANLRTAEASGAPIATMSLARFYRQTYRPIQAIEAYRQYNVREPRIRLVYPEAHIAGEAAVMLFHREMDADDRQELLAWVDSLLSRAIEAGYTNARLLLPIARIRFFLGDTDSGTYFLRELMPNGKLDWRDAINVARTALQEQDTELLQTAFALGISEGPVWNSLGTLVKEVEHDDSLALALYDEAAQLSPGSPVIHTNIARILLECGDDADIPRIKRHLELAGRYGGFSFRWWRPLSNQLAARLSGRPIPTKGYPAKKDRESTNRLYREFLVLEGESKSPHQRGIAFQDLFFRLLRLTFGTERTAGSLNLAGMQSDASFVHGGVGYRVEVSWDSRPNDRSEVDKLKNRLERAIDTRGLLVSMSGFTSGVFEEIERLRGNYIIITLELDEIKDILRGKARLESLLEEKQSRHFLSSFG